jgi:menaquinol-cytochrome c reductase iron-sulfur subunit
MESAQRAKGCHMGTEPSKPRRTFLTALVGLGSAAIGLLLAVPGAAYVVDPLLRGGGARKGRWLKLGSLANLSEDQPVAVPVIGEQTDAWVRSPNVRLGMVWLRKKGESVQALSAECPHLGCKVGYNREQKRFGCPCHESAFSEDGAVLGGPAPRGLDALESRVVDGQVEVRFVRFRAQVKEQVELG